jgi:signal transduction histidine kinase
MRLAEFIERNMEAIVAQWEAFAATLLPAAASMESPALRDHAQQILMAIAKDLTTFQTREAQFGKSTGRAPTPIDAPETAAQTHALLRAREGFDINQLAAEYRALRASVLRLWVDDCEPAAPPVDDMIRFNEAIDQALAESVGFFSEQVDMARNLFLGMLGHDMRSPLQTIQMTALYLARLNAGEQVTGASSRLINSGARTQALLNELLDFNRIQLGVGINIVPSAVDLSKLAADELDQLRAAHPQCRLELEIVGKCEGVWDGRRLQQALGNLVLNAIKYGAPDAPVCVVVTGNTDEVRIDVKNRGEALDPSSLARIFDPLRRGLDHDHERGHDADGSLGLGLYIVREIAKAHGGEINVRSDETETVFSVRLPRWRPQEERTTTK